MKDFIKIEHHSTSFFDRIKYWILIYLGICLLLFFISLFKNGFDINYPAIIFILITIGIAIIFNLKQSFIFLSDFSSDTKNVKIRYYYGTREKIVESEMEQVNIRLKNTSSRLRFNCEIKLEVKHLQFTINDSFDWSLYEIKDLFIFIKESKGEALTDKDKFNITKIENKIYRQ